MKKLTERQLDLIKNWIRISEVIELVYEELSEVELKYGRTSKEYNQVAAKLEIALETEEDIEKEFVTDAEIFLLAKEEMLVKDNEPAPKNERIFARQKMNIDLRKKMIELVYTQVNNSFLEKIKNEIGLPEYIIEDICSVLKENSLNNKNRQERFITMNYLFECMTNKNYLMLLDEEIEKETNEQRKRILIKEKNLLLSRHKGLEKSYFGIEIDVDLELMNHDEFVATILGIPIYQYKKEKKEYLLSKAELLIHYLVPKNKSALLETEKEVIGLELRSIMLELGTKEIEILYDSFEEAKKGINKDNCADYVVDAFYKMNEDFNKDCKRKRMIPND
jgi:hypothetical protein